MDTHAPTEDINGIMDRFRAWTSTQAAGKPKDGVRELTYEEAIGASRPGPVYNELPVSRKRENAVEPCTCPEEAPFEIADPKSAASLKSSVSTRAQKKDGLVRRPTTKPSISRPSHAFRQALAKSIAVLPAKLPSSLVAAHRPLSISIRVSPAEQAIIKARAVEADMSVSAYLRQCALQIEHLRNQTNRSFVERSEQAAAPALGPLARLRQRFFGRTITTLSLRA